MKKIANKTLRLRTETVTLLSVSPLSLKSVAGGDSMKNEGQTACNTNNTMFPTGVGLEDA